MKKMIESDQKKKKEKKRKKKKVIPAKMETIHLSIHWEQNS